LHADIAEALVAKHQLVDHRLVGEIPVVGMLLVDVADAAEKFAEFQGQAGGQAAGHSEGFFHLDAVLVHSQVEHGIKVMIHRRGKNDLGFI
jgi:hypothetical protein